MFTDCAGSIRMRSSSRRYRSVFSALSVATRCSATDISSHRGMSAILREQHTIGGRAGCNEGAGAEEGRGRRSMKSKFAGSLRERRTERDERRDVGGVPRNESR